MDNILTGRASPIHISFPLRRAPRLSVSVRRRFEPEAEDSPLQIKVTNTGGTPVEITSLSVGFIRTFLPAELLLGRRAVRFPLSELAGDAPPPRRVLGSGSVRWTADLSQVKDQLIREQLRSPRLRRTYDDLTTVGYPHLNRFYAELADISPEINDGPRGRLAIKIDNIVRELTHKRLAVVVQYDQGGLYKAQTRWEAPPRRN